MKKTLAIVVAIMMLVSMVAMVAAAEVVSIEDTEVDISVDTEVNGEKTSDISYKFQKSDENETLVTFTYNGKFTVEDWAIAGISASDYEIVSKDGNKLVIRLLSKEAVQKIRVNAKVAGAPGYKAGKTDDGKKSPGTGADAAAAVVFIAAGCVLLAIAMKKKVA